MVKRQIKRAGVRTRTPGITLRHTKNTPYATIDAQRKREIELAISQAQPRLSTTYELDILNLPGWHGLKEYKAKERTRRRKKKKSEQASQKNCCVKNLRNIGTITCRRTYAVKI
mgnify:CR=1 FL=1